MRVYQYSDFTRSHRLNKNWKQIAIWEDNEEETINRAHRSARND